MAVEPADRGYSLRLCRLSKGSSVPDAQGRPSPLRYHYLSTWDRTKARAGYWSRRVGVPWVWRAIGNPSTRPIYTEAEVPVLWLSWRFETLPLPPSAANQPAFLAPEHGGPTVPLLPFTNWVEPGSHVQGIGWKGQSPLTNPGPYGLIIGDRKRFVLTVPD